MLPEMNKSLSNKPELHFFLLLFHFITVVCVFQLMQLHVLKAMRQMQILGEERTMLFEESKMIQLQTVNFIAFLYFDI